MSYKRCLAALMSTVGLTAATVSLAAPANAYTWDGQKPQNTVCANDARTAKYKTAYDRNGKPVAYIELRYSNKCHTAWARGTNYYLNAPGVGHSGTSTIFRTSDKRSYVCYFPAGKNQYCVTKMVYDKDPLSSYAEVEVDAYGDEPGSYYGWPTARTTSY